MRPPCLIYLTITYYATLSRLVTMLILFKTYFQKVNVLPCRVVDYKLSLLAAVAHSPHYRRRVDRWCCCDEVYE